MSFEGAILALDLATVTGWASGLPGERPRCGTIELPRGSEGDNGAVYASFVDWLNGMITLCQPRMLMHEASLPRSAGAAGALAGKLLIGLGEIASLVAYRRRVRCREKFVASVRKHFVGKGNATKDQIYQECRRRGWTPDSLDAADALALWDCACAILAPEAYRRELVLR